MAFSYLVNKIHDTHTPGKLKKHLYDFRKRVPFGDLLLHLLCELLISFCTRTARAVQNPTVFVLHGAVLVQKLNNNSDSKSTSGQFHFRSAAFSAQLKRNVGLTLVKAVVLRINLNLDWSPIVSKSHTHPSHS